MWIVQVIVLVFMALPFALLLNSILTASVLIAGQNVDALVINKRTHSGEDGPLYAVEYKYASGGQQYQGQADVSKKIYDNFQIGDQTPVRLLPALPHPGEILIINQVGSGLCAGFFFVFAVVWIILLTNLLTLNALEPFIASRVFRKGIVTAGKLIQMDWSREKKGTRKLWYEYTVKAKGYVGTVEIMEQSGDQPSIGELVNVIYDQKNPNRSVLYRYSDFKLVPRRK